MRIGKLWLVASLAIIFISLYLAITDRPAWIWTMYHADQDGMVSVNVSPWALFFRAHWLKLIAMASIFFIWMASVVDAARRNRVGWVVAIALVWPVAYVYQWMDEKHDRDGASS